MAASHDSQRLPISEAVAIAMLLWALMPVNPYGYYVLLRFAICGIAIYLAFRAHELEKPAWVWALAITAVLYNPLIRVHLTREIWSVINLATIVLFASSAYALKPKAGKGLTQGGTDGPQAT